MVARFLDRCAVLAVRGGLDCDDGDDNPFVGGNSKSEGIMGRTSTEAMSRERRSN
jgi:hypothetical protein